MLKGIKIGTIAGTIIGFLLLLMEKSTGKKVYTLLMNVDFLPIIGSISWPFYMEWLFHLMLSCAIGMVLVAILSYVSPSRHQQRWLAASVLSLGAALSYFPLTILAVKETPDVADPTALGGWMVSHLVYAVVLKKCYDFL
ncbi:hypothetical protein [Thalassobacillus sp. CUG 92003]|uniref:hypothetical protein n=1 Tax=Thalassobacillus sp. CUG 92003 TaxID=2736641 RepID=UPI0015E6D522|nr:hypothetical protein [Thalassobacillus sp. CUG 92003]